MYIQQIHNTQYYIYVTKSRAGGVTHRSHAYERVHSHKLSNITDITQAKPNIQCTKCTARITRITRTVYNIHTQSITV